MLGSYFKALPVYFLSSTLPTRFLQEDLLRFLADQERPPFLVNTTRSKPNGNFIVASTRGNYQASSKGSSVKCGDLSMSSVGRSDQYPYVGET